MAVRYNDRLKILDDQEIEELYGRPRFNHDERVHFFSLIPEEHTVVDDYHTLASRVLFILQVGFFKAKALFYAFEFDDVKEDMRHILQQHYPHIHNTELICTKPETDPPCTTAEDSRFVWLPSLQCRGARNLDEEGQPGCTHFSKADFSVPKSFAVLGRPPNRRARLQFYARRGEPSSR